MFVTSLFPQLRLPGGGGGSQHQHQPGEQGGQPGAAGLRLRQLLQPARSGRDGGGRTLQLAAQIQLCTEQNST